MAVSRAVDGAGLFAEWMRKETAFIATLPGCATRNFDPHIVFGHDILKFVPLRGMYRGDRDAPAILVRNRFGGVTAINPFSSRQNRWAGLVVGPTGSGKSVLTNGIIAGAMAYDPVVVIVDMSRASSYEPIVSSFGGSFIPVAFNNSDNRVNMFDLRVGFEQPAGSKVLSLNAIFATMLSQNGKGVSKEALSILERTNKENLRSLFQGRTPTGPVGQIGQRSPGKGFEDIAVIRNVSGISRLLHQEILIYPGSERFQACRMAQCLATPTLNDFMRVLASDPR